MQVDPQPEESNQHERPNDDDQSNVQILGEQIGSLRRSYQDLASDLEQLDDFVSQELRPQLSSISGVFETCHDSFGELAAERSYEHQSVQRYNSYIEPPPQHFRVPRRPSSPPINPPSHRGTYPDVSPPNHYQHHESSDAPRYRWSYPQYGHSLDSSNSRSYRPPYHTPSEPGFYSPRVASPPRIRPSCEGSASKRMRLDSNMENESSPTCEVPMTSSPAALVPSGPLVSRSPDLPPRTMFRPSDRDQEQDQAMTKPRTYSEPAEVDMEILKDKSYRQSDSMVDEGDDAASRSNREPSLPKVGTSERLDQRSIDTLIQEWRRNFPIPGASRQSSRVGRWPPHGEDYNSSRPWTRGAFPPRVEGYPSEVPPNGFMEQRHDFNPEPAFVDRFRQAPPTPRTTSSTPIKPPRYNDEQRTPFVFATPISPQEVLLSASSPATSDTSSAILDPYGHLRHSPALVLLRSDVAFSPIERGPNVVTDRICMNCCGSNYYHRHQEEQFEASVGTNSDYRYTDNRPGGAPYFPPSPNHRASMPTPPDSIPRLPGGPLCGIAGGSLDGRGPPVSAADATASTPMVAFLMTPRPGLDTPSWTSSPSSTPMLPTAPNTPAFSAIPVLAASSPVAPLLALEMPGSSPAYYQIQQSLPHPPQHLPGAPLNPYVHLRPGVVRRDGHNHDDLPPPNYVVDAGGGVGGGECGIQMMDHSMPFFLVPHPMPVPVVFSAHGRDGELREERGPREAGGNGDVEQRGADGC
ncbi:hypothetical protein HK102_003008 [Quaeritorhiza haematococci]|nr:hypothetical protein HK102_003008 [Quaeritorhiza haematococci]